MKKIKVGSWYNKLTPKEKAYFGAKVEFYGIQKLRSFFSTAKKQFNYQICDDHIEFLGGLQVIVNNTVYYFSSDRKEFCQFQTGVK